MSSVEKKFEERILSNVSFLEGQRGLFMCLVLLDHFYNDFVSKYIVVDTYLFVILMAFTFALQLRVIPKFARVDGTLLLVDRKPFSPFQFMTQKYLGIHPLLWFTILISIPMYFVLHLSLPNICYPMIFFGIDTILNSYFPCYEDKISWYASALIIGIAIYALARYAVTSIEDLLMKGRDDKIFIPYSRQAELLGGNYEETKYFQARDEKMFDNRIGNVVTLLVYARVDTQSAICITLILVVLASFVILISTLLFPYHPVFHLSCFFAGCFGAYLVEIWYYASLPSRRSVNPTKNEIESSDFDESSLLLRNGTKNVSPSPYLVYFPDIIGKNTCIYIFLSSHTSFNSRINNFIVTHAISVSGCSL